MNEQTNKDNEPDGDLLVYQWLLFWLSRDLVSITSPYHTIDKKKISGSASTGCDKKKNCSTGPCAIITNTYCCKKSIACPEARIHQTISINIYSFFFFFFFFFVDLWSSPFFFYFMNFILCLMNVLISCCKFRGEVCFVYCLLAQHSLFINFSCLTSSLTVND